MFTGEFLWWWGLLSHFRVQPNYSVEVVLCCVVVGVVTIILFVQTGGWWWWVDGGGVCTFIFVSNPTTMLRFCCVVLSLGL